MKKFLCAIVVAPVLSLTLLWAPAQASQVEGLVYCQICTDAYGFLNQLWNQAQWFFEAADQWENAGIDDEADGFRVQGQLALNDYYEYQQLFDESLSWLCGSFV